MIEIMLDWLRWNGKTSFCCLPFPAGPLLSVWILLTVFNWTLLLLDPFPFATQFLVDLPGHSSLVSYPTLNLPLSLHFLFCGPWMNHLKPIFSSVQFSHSVMSNSLWHHESQHTRPPCPSLTPGVHSDSCPLSWWCHPAISSSVVPFSSCPQSLPASESFPMSQLFASGSQSILVSALASFLPKNTQDWYPLEWTGWISLLSKGLSRVFSNTTVQVLLLSSIIYNME